MKDIQIGGDRTETDDTSRYDRSFKIIVSVGSFKRPNNASHSDNAIPYNIQTGCTSVTLRDTKHGSRSNTGCTVDRQYSSTLLTITWNSDSSVTLVSGTYDEWLACIERPLIGHAIQTGTGVRPISYIMGLLGGGVKGPKRKIDLSPRLTTKLRVSPPKSLLPSRLRNVKFTIEKAMKALWESSYSSTLSFTSVLDREGWITPHPDVLPLVKKPVTYCTGGWVGPRAGLDGCGKYRSHRDLIPIPSIPWRVATLTHLHNVSCSTNCMER